MVRSSVIFSYGSLSEFNSATCPSFDKLILMSWSKRDKVWSSANSLFKWCFRSLHRCFYLSSLMILFEDDFPGPPPIGQGSFKRYLPSTKKKKNQSACPAILLDRSLFEPWEVFAHVWSFDYQGPFHLSELASQTITLSVTLKMKSAFSKSFCWKTISLVQTFQDLTDMAKGFWNYHKLRREWSGGSVLTNCMKVPS